MDWSKVKDAVAKAAPLAGSLLGGPAGGAVGAVIASALGVEATPSAVQQALQTDPQAAVKLAELESRERITFEQMALESERDRLKDVADARKRDTALQTTHGKNRRGDVLAYSAVLGFIVMLVCLFTVEISEGPTRDVLMVMTGILGAIVKDVYQFEFGSSRGSKEKSGLMALGR